jgi:hypothetical protein
MLFVSARIPTSFTCTSICKTTEQRKFCFNGPRRDPGAFVFQKPPRARSLRKVATGIFSIIKDTTTRTQSKNPKKIRSESSAYSVPLW